MIITLSDYALPVHVGTILKYTTLKRMLNREISHIARHHEMMKKGKIGPPLPKRVPHASQ